MLNLGSLTPRRPRARSAMFALLALFWVAQLQGLAHAVSHLSARAEGLAAAHALVCSDCASATTAGAAPLPTLAGLAVPLPAAEAPARSLPAAPDREVAFRYRSRAPPAAPI